MYQVTRRTKDWVWVRWSAYGAPDQRRGLSLKIPQSEFKHWVSCESVACPPTEKSVIQWRPPPKRSDETGEDFCLTCLYDFAKYGAWRVLMNQKRNSATARVTTSLANMDGPMTVGRAGWINPFGFFIFFPHQFLHFLTRHGLGGPGRGGFWGCSLCIFKQRFITLLSAWPYKAVGGEGGL